MRSWKCGVTYSFLIVLLAACTLFLGACGKEDQLEPCTVKQYNEAGELTGSSKKDAYDFATEIYDNNGKLQEKYEMERESDGRLTERKTYDGEGNLINTDKYEYKGNTAAVTTYDSSGEKSGYSSEWEFDSGNRPVKVTTFNEEGDVIAKSELERDSYGSIKKVTFYDGSSGELRLYSKQKSKITYKSGRPVKSEDEITYYSDDGEVSGKQKSHREFEY